MSGNHGAGSNERSLWIALVPTATFMVAEIVGGLLTGSLALISDAAHMATDVVGLVIAITAIRIGRRPPDARRSFGYERFEILAAAFNALLLFGVALYILYEAWRRLSEPGQIDSTAMLVIAVLGLGVNLFAVWMLRSKQDNSLNVKGAYLEVLSDLLGSVGVIAAAIIIRFTGWEWVDSLIAVAIGLWVLPRSWTLLRQSVNILLEGVPDGIDPAAVHATLRGLPGVTDVHDLHIWALTGGRVSLTAHLVVSGGDAAAVAGLLDQARAMLHERFDIGHVTLQCEPVPCADAAAGHRFL
ncbi:cation diffusion facilitator family transporter [Inquilinus limosus]|uniref:Cation transporter n=1 Tax=Inquilinus limosus TaxID=171674 RepID=A0A211ZM90_9PROT|nr:cation diffusion facilitator family transporter [Inquilinus limosus]OWJ66391.1 cation transporter [Inquilinus limosus]